MRPHNFAYGRKAPDGGHWILLGEKYETNPKFLLTPNDMEMVAIWRRWQDGIAGRGQMPEAGGYLDQAAIMMEAMHFMNRAEDLIKKEELWS